MIYGYELKEILDTKDYLIDKGDFYNFKDVDILIINDISFIYADSLQIDDNDYLYIYDEDSLLLGKIKIEYINEMSCKTTDNIYELKR